MLPFLHVDVTAYPYIVQYGYAVHMQAHHMRVRRAELDVQDTKLPNK